MPLLGVSFPCDIGKIEIMIKPRREYPTLNRPLCSRSFRRLDHDDGSEFGEAVAAIKPEVTGGRAMADAPRNSAG